MSRYLIIPSLITSKTDGQRHNITAAQLIRCYDLDQRHCLIYHPAVHSLSDPEIRAMMWLGPRYHGGYPEYRKHVESLHAIACWEAAHEEERTRNGGA